jgi:hypothetical protein
VPPLASPPIAIDDGHRVGTTYYPGGNTTTGGQGQPVMGLSCGVMVENYHVHSHVSLILNGQALALPGNIGIVALTPTSNCFYNIHTHDTSGKVHVESPAPATFTLGQLFAIWGRPLGPTNTGDHPGLPVVIYIVDEGATAATKFEGDFATIELLSHRGIVIQIGTEIPEIPTFSWAGR